MEVSPKPQSHVSTDKDIRSPIPPAHQEAPVGTKQCPCESVSTTSQGIAAGKFSIGQCDQQGYAKSEKEGQECSWPSPSCCGSDQHEDPAANRATYTECDRFTQRKHPAKLTGPLLTSNALALLFHVVHSSSLYDLPLSGSLVVLPRPCVCPTRRKFVKSAFLPMKLPE